MGTGNIMSGMGSQRDTALRGGCRDNSRAYNLGVDKERAVHPLGLSESIKHADLVAGDLISIEGGKVVPLNPSLEFGGIIEQVAQNGVGYVASVTIRGAIHARVRGLRSDTRPGAKVYASPGSIQVLTVEETGVCVGAICAIENLEREKAIIGIKLPGDSRRFEPMSGAR